MDHINQTIFFIIIISSIHLNFTFANCLEADGDYFEGTKKVLNIKKIDCETIVVTRFGIASTEINTKIKINESRKCDEFESQSICYSASDLGSHKFKFSLRDISKSSSEIVESNYLVDSVKNEILFKGYLRRGKLLFRRIEEKTLKKQ